MVEKARKVLLNTDARRPKLMKMELWTYVFKHVLTQWSNTSRKYLQYKTPDENLMELRYTQK